jgi:MFS family permease
LGYNRPADRRWGLQLLLGRLIDRYGPRVLIPASTAIVGVALIGVNRANTPWQIIALFGLAGMTGLATSMTTPGVTYRRGG